MDNKDVAIRFHLSKKGGKIDESLMTDDFTAWSNFTGEMTRENYLAAVAGMFSMFQSDITFTFGDITAEGDRVAMEAITNVPLPNGGIYANTYHYLLYFRDGKVRRQKEFLDTRYIAAVMAPLVPQIAEFANTPVPKKALAPRDSFPNR